MPAVTRQHHAVKVINRRQSPLLSKLPLICVKSVHCRKVSKWIQMRSVQDLQFPRKLRSVFEAFEEERESSRGLSLPEGRWGCVLYASARGVWEIRRKSPILFWKSQSPLGGEQFATAGSLWGPSSCWKHLVLTQAITTKGQFTTSPSNTSSTKIHFRSG